MTTFDLEDDRKAVKMNGKIKNPGETNNLRFFS
jgi:hypothetical protein